jgi:MoxR-like ATPase
MVTAVSHGRTAGEFDLSSVQPVASAEELVAMQRGTAAVRVDPVVLDYAVRVSRATREWHGIAMGAGPRGSLALVRAARGKAVLSGRDFVTPDDVRGIAVPALRHRLLLSPEMQIEGRRIDDVLEALLQKVDAPRT